MVFILQRSVDKQHRSPTLDKLHIYGAESVLQRIFVFVPVRMILSSGKIIMVRVCR